MFQVKWDQIVQTGKSEHFLQAFNLTYAFFINFINMDQTKSLKHCHMISSAFMQVLVFQDGTNYEHFLMSIMLMYHAQYYFHKSLFPKIMIKLSTFRYFNKAHTTLIW